MDLISAEDIWIGPLVIVLLCLHYTERICLRMDLRLFISGTARVPNCFRRIVFLLLPVYRVGYKNRREVHIFSSQQFCNLLQSYTAVW